MGSVRVANRRKLIEVALPLEIINREASREKSVRSGNPSTLHLWWSRKPLAAARAVLFAQLADDPASRPDLFPSEAEQNRERRHLLDLLGRLAIWESTTDEAMLSEARGVLSRYLGDRVPTLFDPFAGGGSIPLEAQRLGLPVVANDLNPVAVILNRALLELGPRFIDHPAISPSDRATLVTSDQRGLIRDIQYYAQMLSDRAQERVRDLYPTVLLDDGSRATAMAWLWVRAVVCPNPACRAEVPLINTFDIGKRRGNLASVDPMLRNGERRVDFEVRADTLSSRDGNLTRSGAECFFCSSAFNRDYIRDEASAGRLSERLFAIVAEGNRRRVYQSPDAFHEKTALEHEAEWRPEGPLSPSISNATSYGRDEISDLFTERQLTTLRAFSDAVPEVRAEMRADGGEDDYVDALTAFLALGVGRLANRASAHCIWNNQGEKVEQTFAANTNIPMTWLFAEANPFSDSSGNFTGQVDYLVKSLDSVTRGATARVTQSDARSVAMEDGLVVSTDPPYYDTFRYGELSDFFYIWLRPILRDIYPSLFATMLTPKGDELMPNAGSDEERAVAFEERLRKVFSGILAHHDSSFPFTIYYAYRQRETARGEDISTGWERMLQGLVDSGAMVTATWPVSTERRGGLRNLDRSALASSIVLACRPRAATAGITDRQGFIRTLKDELPDALRKLQQGSIAPVDLAQAAIGPGMAVFSRFARVIEPNGSPMRVGSALDIINRVLADVLEEQEGEFDAETRWAIKWFEQHGFDAGPFGEAETLFTATATALDGLKSSGIVDARAGRVWLVSRRNMDAAWDPSADSRIPIWEVTMQLTKRLEEGGEEAAAELLARVDRLGEVGRDLAYRLFNIAEQKKWANEALAFNSLVSAWPELQRKAADQQGQTTLNV